MMPNVLREQIVQKKRRCELSGRDGVYVVRCKTDILVAHQVSGSPCNFNKRDRPEAGGNSQTVMVYERGREA
jgi:hypothetical protein